MDICAANISLSVLSICNGILLLSVPVSLDSHDHNSGTKGTFPLSQRQIPCPCVSEKYRNEEFLISTNTANR